MPIDEFLSKNKQSEDAGENDLLEDNADLDEQKHIFMKDYLLDEDVAEVAAELVEQEGLDEDEAAELAELL